VLNGENLAPRLQKLLALRVVQGIADGISQPGFVIDGDQTPELSVVQNFCGPAGTIRAHHRTTAQQGLYHDIPETFVAG